MNYSTAAFFLLILSWTPITSSFAPVHQTKHCHWILRESSVEEDNSVSTAIGTRAPQIEIDRRRNLAIISHPDSGKTTMTEKLLLYGGAIQQAGAVRQKAEQRATASDFMEMEKERGISISSTVMNFDYHDLRVNILGELGIQCLGLYILPSYGFQHGVCSLVTFCSRHTRASRLF
jgi:hypothetical protein